MCAKEDCTAGSSLKRESGHGEPEARGDKCLNTVKKIILTFQMWLLERWVNEGFLAGIIVR